MERNAEGQGRMRQDTPPGPQEHFFDADTIHDLDASRSTCRAIHGDDAVDRWIAERRSAPRLASRVIPIDRMEGWQIDGATGNIGHISGRFFLITGIQARQRTRSGDLEWDQPIIDQPEIGILGILAKKIDGILHFCLQAKEEPGNIHSVQLSPTVQATYSNYTRVHGGKLPRFVEYFLEPAQHAVLYAKLQTEDGGRFLFKSNRNMIVRVEDDMLNELPDGYIWLTLRQIARLMRRDNLINACARSVISAVVISSGTPADACLRDHQPAAGLCRSGRAGTSARRSASSPLRERAVTGCMPIGHIQWLDDMKAGNHMFQKRIPLRDLWDWDRDAVGHLVHRKGKFFKIIGLQVTSRSREVRSWSQPIIDNIASGIIGILIRRTPQGMQYLMQAKAEVGNRSIIQIAPTVQFTQENYLQNERLNKPFLYEEFIAPGLAVLVADSRQCEEGARFYHEEHLHRILLLPDHSDLDIPPDFRWFTASELHWFLHFGEMVNSSARSILALCFSTPGCCGTAMTAERHRRDHELVRKHGNGA